MSEGTDYSKYDGKNVIVVKKLAEADEDGNTAVEIEGKVQVGNTSGILIKPKGKVAFDMIEADQIEEVTFVPTKLKELKAKELKPVEHGSARTHLLERHGVTLDWVNSNSEEDALKYHETLDHVELKLGHVHKSADESERSKAVAAAEEDEPAA